MSGLLHELIPTQAQEIAEMQLRLCTIAAIVFGTVKEMALKFLPRLAELCSMLVTVNSDGVICLNYNCDSSKVFAPWVPLLKLGKNHLHSGIGCGC